MDVLKGLLGKGDKEKTFKELKHIKEGTKRFELKTWLMATLGKGDLRGAVKLPPGEDKDEWLAMNTIDFYNQVNMIYGHVAEFCTQKSCPTMSAGPKYEWFWADGKQIKKPIGVSAPEYVDYLMEWIQSLFEDPTVFPPEEKQGFPPNFHEVVKQIFKRLFRVFAHIYYHHSQDIIKEGVEAALNSGFKHFYLFSCEFELIEDKDLVPLHHLTKKIDAATKA